MKFCPVVPEICRGQVHGPRKERKKEKKENNNNNNNNNNNQKRRKTINLQRLFVRLKYTVLKYKTSSVTIDNWLTHQY